MDSGLHFPHSIGLLLASQYVILNPAYVTVRSVNQTSQLFGNLCQLLADSIHALWQGAR